MADRLVSEGYAALGYRYLMIDDCWLSKDRDAQGRLQPDPERFPYGMQDLAAYVIKNLLVNCNCRLQYKINSSDPLQRTEIWTLRRLRKLYLRWLPWRD
jgi:Alpha galactosidase A